MEAWKFANKWLLTLSFNFGGSAGGLWLTRELMPNMKGAAPK